MRTILAVSIVALALVGCARPSERICTTPPSLKPRIFASTNDRAAEEDFKGCIHRWAYRLAPAKERPSEVVAAVLGACQGTFSAYASERYEFARKHDLGSTATSDRTGQETTIEADVTEEAQGLAQFHVIQARAGKCRVP